MTYTADHIVNATGADAPGHGFWRAQRVAWLLLVGLLVGAFLALNGGAQSYATVGDDAFSVRYPVVLQQQVPANITVTATDPKSETVVHFDRDFLNNFTITAMQPAPVKEFQTSWGVAYRFAMAASDTPASLRVEVRANVVGLSSYTIVVDGRLAMLSTRVVP